MIPHINLSSFSGGGKTTISKILLGTYRTVMIPKFTTRSQRPTGEIGGGQVACRMGGGEHPGGERGGIPTISRAVLAYCPRLPAGICIDLITIDLRRQLTDIVDALLDIIRDRARSVAPVPCIESIGCEPH